MIRGYAAVKGNLRRPRKGATVYKRPELAVVFGALEAVPGGLCSKAPCLISPLQPYGREDC